jgi:hypothetical protein
MANLMDNGHASELPSWKSARLLFPRQVPASVAQGRPVQHVICMIQFPEDVNSTGLSPIGTVALVMG